MDDSENWFEMDSPICNHTLPSLATGLGHLPTHMSRRISIRSAIPNQSNNHLCGRCRYRTSKRKCGIHSDHSSPHHLHRYRSKPIIILEPFRPHHIIEICRILQASPQPYINHAQRLDVRTNLRPRSHSRTERMTTLQL
jgi:hypothetical protein